MNGAIGKGEALKVIRIPVPGTDLEPADPERIKRLTKEKADARAALEVLGRSLKVAMADFEALRRVIVGDEESITHACPTGDSGIMPCCGRGTMDVPLTEPVTMNRDAVTCQGVRP